MAGKLYSPPKPATVTSLGMRLLFVVTLVALAVVIIRLEKEGLIDHSTGEHPGLVDSIYFAMVTITTVGYGDIVPISTSARLVDSILLVPIRFIVLFTFVGTAYQLVIERFQQEVRMKRAVKRLKDHVIVCGYGAPGRAAVKELLLQGTPPEQVVVLDTDEEALRDAVETNVVAVDGDAAEESVLRSVAIDRAAFVIVCAGRDDTAVLIALTAHDLNPSATLIATCREEENVKLLQRSGANIIVSPAIAGGNLLAAATRRAHLVETMQDILSVGGTMRLDERRAEPEEVGKHPSELKNLSVIRVYRGNRHYNVGEFPVLEPDDTLVLVALARDSGT